jgi:Putative MetA-pathway of phenol degradation
MIRIISNVKSTIYLLLVLSVPVIGSPVKDTTAINPEGIRYTLFHPVPENSLRELNADRPDKTDCPFTVDAGHFQVEMDLVNMTSNQPDSKHNYIGLKSVEMMPVNLKIGLLSNLDFQLVFTSYRWDKINDQNNNTTYSKEGFNGITPRFKVNLIGNDGGFFALALIPFLSLSIGQNPFGNNSVEGGLGIPFAFDIPGWDVGFQSTIHINRNDTGTKYHSEFDNSVSIGHSIFGSLSLSGEFFSSVSAQSDMSWVGTLDTWLTYQFNENFRVDGGVYIGLTPAADEWHPWMGFTWRY